MCQSGNWSGRWCYPLNIRIICSYGMVETSWLVDKLPGWTQSFPHACKLAKGIYNGGHIDTIEERDDVTTKPKASSATWRLVNSCFLLHILYSFLSLYWLNLIACIAFFLLTSCGNGELNIWIWILRQWRWKGWSKGACGEMLHFLRWDLYEHMIPYIAYRLSDTS